MGLTYLMVHKRLALGNIFEHYHVDPKLLNCNFSRFCNAMSYLGYPARLVDLHWPVPMHNLDLFCERFSMKKNVNVLNIARKKNTI